MVAGSDNLADSILLIIQSCERAPTCDIPTPDRDCVRWCWTRIFIIRPGLPIGSDHSIETGRNSQMRSGKIEWPVIISDLNPRYMNFLCGRGNFFNTAQFAWENCVRQSEEPGSGDSIPPTPIFLALLTPRLSSLLHRSHRATSRPRQLFMATFTHAISHARHVSTTVRICSARQVHGSVQNGVTPLSLGSFLASIAARFSFPCAVARDTKFNSTATHEDVYVFVKRTRQMGGSLVIVPTSVTGCAPNR
jgi:hypothetical protein